jgi:hypothetical protein
MSSARDTVGPVSSPSVDPIRRSATANARNGANASQIPVAPLLRRRVASFKAGLAYQPIPSRYAAIDPAMAAWSSRKGQTIVRSTGGAREAAGRAT